MDETKMDERRLTQKAKLVIKLLETTRTGKLEWNRTATEHIFEASLPDYSIMINAEEAFDHDSQEVDTNYYISLYNNEGKMVDKFDAYRLHYENEKFQGSTMYLLTKELYERARGLALGSDKAINEILKYLDESI